MEKYLLKSKNARYVKRQRLIEEKQEQSNIMRHRAKILIELADSVREPERYKTLYYGLKRNHPRNVAVMHPLMFMMRRIIYALTIVFMDEIPIWGVFIFMGYTLLMLGYVLSEHQWKDRVINSQHIFNECILYVLSVMMLLFSSYVEPSMRYILGFLLIAIVFIFVVYNLVIMLLFSCKLLILIIRRQFYRLKRAKLSSEVKKIVNDIQINLEKMWF